MAHFELASAIFFRAIETKCNGPSKHTSRVSKVVPSRSLLRAHNEGRNTSTNDSEQSNTASWTSAHLGVFDELLDELADMEKSVPSSIGQAPCTPVNSNMVNSRDPLLTPTSANMSENEGSNVSTPCSDHFNGFCQRTPLHPTRMRRNASASKF